jgi:shikimate dehydrogenase
MERTTQLYGVIGHPVAHSLSPFMMNRAFRQADVDAVYLRFDVEPEHFARAVEGLTALGARGANVTYPFKEEILHYVDVPSPDAQLIGAANTLLITDSQIIAHNTDAPGAANALETFAGLAPRDKNIFIFGAGGSARAAAVGLLRAGAGGVTFGVRTPDKAVAPLNKLRDAFPLQSIDFVPLGEALARDDFVGRLRQADVVINATPVGMGRGAESRHPPLVDSPDHIHPGQCYFDFVYHPGRTEFLETASDAGAGILGGVSQLVCQAVESFRQWTGRTFDARDMAEAMEAAFPERTIG